MLKDGLNATEVAAQEEREKQARLEAERRRAAAIERAAWAELYHVYERCIGIAEKLWATKLDNASAQQQALSEQMRDRGSRRYETPNGEITFSDGQGIPVPLFTPRDRLQFIKECAVSLLISADRRNLTALYKDQNGETELAQTKEAAAGQGPVEAASGTDEANEDAPQEYGERLSQASAPSL